MTQKVLLTLSAALLMILQSASAFADVGCTFVPKVVKQGEFGANEALLFVCGYEGSEWNCFNLGNGDDSFAKNRQAIAMAALLSGKQVTLRFWGPTFTSCTVAMNDKIVPNSIWIIK